MHNIGVIGTGFVGTAVVEGMKHAFEVLSYDKAKGIRRNGLLLDWTTTDPLEWLVRVVDGPIFVCVPTPMNPDGSCNTTIVEDVVDSLSETAKKFNKTGVVVVIKSTVVPGTTLKLNQKYDNLYVCFNPEFLTERSYIEDFKNQDRIIIGGPHEGTNILKQVYDRAYPNVPVTKTSSTIAELVKYTTNCFLATKVSFANEMKQICDKLDTDYDKVIEYAIKDKRLGVSHWSVPGPMPANDGSNRLLLGFSGSCFVKDLNALMHLAKELEIDPKVMEGAWKKNEEVRPEKDWINLKGRAIM